MQGENSSDVKALSYEKIKSSFQRKLWLYQMGIMNNDSYMTFIKPYLQEAEETLAALQYFKENPSSPFFEEYLHVIYSFNNACFYALLDHNHEWREKHHKQYQIRSNVYIAGLRCILEQMQKEAKLDLVIEQELQKTITLITEINSAYIKNNHDKIHKMIN